MKEIEFILYVLDQEKSTIFYEQLLQMGPSLNVPGMTEFELTDFVTLGLMPENGIAKITITSVAETVPPFEIRAQAEKCKPGILRMEFF